MWAPCDEWGVIEVTREVGEAPNALGRNELRLQVRAEPNLQRRARSNSLAPVALNPFPGSSR